MPLFEYACTACGHEFEAFVTSSRVPVCPSCQSEKLEKLISRLGRISGQGGSVSGGAPVFSGG